MMWVPAGSLGAAGGGLTPKSQAKGKGNKNHQAPSDQVFKFTLPFSGKHMGDEANTWIQHLKDRAAEIDI